jgi:hypothetical protein
MKQTFLMERGRKLLDVVIKMFWGGAVKVRARKIRPLK